MPDFAGSKKAAAFSRGTHVERKEFRRRIRLMSQKISLPHLLYIQYTRFSGVRKFLSDFFCWRLPATDIQRPSAGAYLSAGLRNLEFRQQLFAQSYLYTDTGERSLPLATVLPSGLTGPHSPARLIFFIWQISSFCL